MTTSPEDGPAGVGDALRFAFGTLTALPVRVTRWDRAAARGGMLAAPLVGLNLGLLAAGAGGLLLLAGSGSLLAAVATVAVPAALTRGLHLDGLADTADGLGSGRPTAEALRIMRQSDIGPFGVIVLVLTLLAQVAAVHELYAAGWSTGAVAVTAAAVTARSALTLTARATVPPARPEGLGAAVAGVLRSRTALGTAALSCAVLAGAAGALSGPTAAVHTAVSVLVGLAAAEVLLRHCVRRLGGVTGDVFGALSETATTAALLAAATG